MENEHRNGPENDGEKLYAYIAIGLIAVGAILLGLSFTALGSYSLLGCMLLEIIAITFVNLQKRKNDFKWLIYIKIAAYIVFIVALVLFVGGTVNTSKD